MKTILSIRKEFNAYKAVAVIDIDEYNIENRIKFIAAILGIKINDSRTYYDLFKELYTNKTITINDSSKDVYLTFDEIAEY